MADITKHIRAKCEYLKAGIGLLLFCMIDANNAIWMLMLSLIKLQWNGSRIMTLHSMAQRPQITCDTIQVHTYRHCQLFMPQ